MEKGIIYFLFSTHLLCKEAGEIEKETIMGEAQNFFMTGQFSDEMFLTDLRI